MARSSAELGVKCSLKLLTHLRRDFYKPHLGFVHLMDRPFNVNVLSVWMGYLGVIIMVTADNIFTDPALTAESLLLFTAVDPQVDKTLPCSLSCCAHYPVRLENGEQKQSCVPKKNC